MSVLYKNRWSGNVSKAMYGDFMQWIKIGGCRRMIIRSLIVTFCWHKRPFTLKIGFNFRFFSHWSCFCSLTKRVSSVALRDTIRRVREDGKLYVILHKSITCYFTKYCNLTFPFGDWLKEMLDFSRFSFLLKK